MCLQRLSVLSVFCISVLTTLTKPAAANPVVPDFDPADFVAGAPIDNPYFPLKPGTVFTYGAQVNDEGDTAFELEKDFVTFQTKLIAGVHATIVHAKTWHDGVLIEDTFDYHAQDKFGNVWYLGENTKAFDYDDNGNLIDVDTSGSFLAGVNGAKPGFIMPADPQVGFEYYQEFSAADEALDSAKIVSLNEHLTLPIGSFSNVLKTVESTVLEPGLTENKFYAKGIGQILTLEDIDATGNPLNTIPLQSVATVPLPPAAMTGFATLAAVLVATVIFTRRRHSS
jgi:hypothetical protein